MADVLVQAAGNAVVGISTVFIVLLLISLIIFCFNIFPYLEKKLKKEEKVETVAAPVVNKVQEIVEDEVPVAVIAAAIAAYEEANGYTGGFYVRSIKRRR